MGMRRRMSRVRLSVVVRRSRIPRRLFRLCQVRIPCRGRRRCKDHRLRKAYLIVAVHLSWLHRSILRRRIGMS